MWLFHLIYLSFFFFFLICLCAETLSHARLFGTPWNAACQAPVSMEFSRQEYWNGLSFLPPGDLSDPGIEPVFSVSSALASGLFTTETSQECTKVKGMDFPDV